MQKFKPQSCVRIFLQQIHPIHAIWSFGAFHSVWVHLGPFRYCTKLGPKRAELMQLMQMLMARSGVGIFRYERTQSTPMDPKLMFWCVS